MTKRMFNEDEIKMTNTSLTVLDTDVAHIKWLIKYNTIMHDEGLEMNYLEKKRAYKKQIKIDVDELALKEATIATLRDQLENGVEEIVIVEDTPEEEEE